eukprot:1077185_1
MPSPLIFRMFKTSICTFKEAQATENDQLLRWPPSIYGNSIQPNRTNRPFVNCDGMKIKPIHYQPAIKNTVFLYCSNIIRILKNESLHPHQFCSDEINKDG